MAEPTRVDDGDETPSERIAREHAFARVHGELLGSSMHCEFGRFRLDQRLGGGAQGQVYAAYDPQLDRTVALKILRADSPASEARALAEGRALAAVGHENLIPIYEVVSERGGCALVMELAAGPTLRTWLRPGRSFDETIAMLLGVGRGLAALHRCGLIHRDVKPANVVIGTDGTPRLVDLGLARASRSVTPDSGCGTPSYMAPEQRAGSAEVGPAADQYAFAVMAWEAVTGQRPEAPEGGSTGRPRRMPRRLAAVLRRALHPDPTARHPDLEALLVAMERGQRARRLGRRGVGAGGLLLAIGLGASALPPVAADPCAGAAGDLGEVQWNSADREELRGRLAGLDVAAAPDFADLVVGRLDQRVASLAGFQRELCHAERAGRPVAAARSCLERHEAVFPSLVASLRDLDGAALSEATMRISRLGSPSACRELIDAPPPVPASSDPAGVGPNFEVVQTDLARLELACDPTQTTACLVAADAFAERVAGEPECAYAPELALLRGHALHRARPEEALELVTAAAWTAERCGRGEVELRAKTLAAGVAALAGHHERAGVWLGAAEATLARLGSATPARRARMLDARSVVATSEGKLQEALALSLEVVALQESQGAGARDQLAASYANAGRLARDVGDLDLATTLLTESLAQIERDHGPDHPVVARALGSLAHVRDSAGDSAAALELLERASEILERWEEPRLLAASLNNRAAVHQRLGQIDRTVPLLTRAYAIQQETLGEDDPAMIRSLSNLGRAVALAGDPAEGVAKMRTALDVAGAQLPPRHEVTLTARGNLASVLLETGGYAEAAEHACGVAQIRLAQTQGRHPDFVDASRVCVKSLVASYLRGDGEADIR
jgi:tetratricopeptide (TPR) repeat protein